MSLTQAAKYRETQGPTAPRNALIEELRALSLEALRRMYLPERRLFAFRLRRHPDAPGLEGVSPRYTAIALLGLAREGEEATARVFGEVSAGEVWRSLGDEVSRAENLGDIALTLWAGRLLGEDETRIEELGNRLGALRPLEAAHPTVELAWSLMALSADADSHAANEELARGIAERLTASFSPQSGLFRHYPAGTRRWSLRSHVSCFADAVYPIQALGRYFRWSGEGKALLAARQCAARICALQGPAGQWWWHYDARTGQVVEPYPVYAVHQDAMAPMALFELQDACGDDYRGAAERGLQWLYAPPEIGFPLVDASAGVIWRKVARREPMKLSRTLQAAASRLHPTLRVPGLERIFPPVSVDYECRPYHLGWLLYAWADRQCGKQTERRDQ